jgi:membrane-associated phospholipid phosphatase
VRLRLVVTALVTLAGSGRAQSARPDSATIPDRQLFHRSDLYVAAGFAAGTLAMLPLDKELARSFTDQRLRGNRTVDQLARTAEFFGGKGPLIIGPAMYVVGRFGHMPKMAELAVHGTEALVVGSAFGTAIKVMAGRARPYVSTDTNPGDFSFGRGLKNRDFMAFPSGHTTAAFSVAAAVVTETYEWWPSSVWYVAPVMYGGATAVGLSRMYDNQHWASDVVMGAAIGTFAGLKTVRFNHTHAGNQLDQILLGARVVPTPNGTALAWSGSF